MPIYEFMCKRCRHIFERLLFGSEAQKEQTCPRCGKEAQKVLSGFSNFKTTVNPLRTASQSCGPSRGFS